MSFSGKVKEELSQQWSSARHCQIAEIAALIGMCGAVTINSFNQYGVKINTENLAVARKVFTLIRKTFNIEADISIRRNIEKQSAVYSVMIVRHEDALRVLQAAKLLEEHRGGFEEFHIVSPLIVQQPCCRRAFLRGAFLGAGSMSDPNKSYHFEIVCDSDVMAKQIQRLMCDFSMDAKIVRRKKSYVVYLKEGDQIADILNIMEAHVSLMELENIRILKDMRNTVNRKVNCETANINKTVSAAVKQLEDITYLRDNMGLEKLAEGLREVAYARLSHPDATLKELGELLSPPVGKSGVNHRLRKLSDLAEKERQTRRIIMIETPVIVGHEDGIEGRPIALLVQEASQYASKVYIQVDNKKINAKSIMGMMSLALQEGDEVTVVAEGEDEEKAAEGIKTFLKKTK